LSRTTFWWYIHPRLLRNNLNVALTLHDLEELPNVSGRWQRLMAKTLIAQSVACVEDPWFEIRLDRWCSIQNCIQLFVMTFV
jgi:hypothetical protein